MISSLNRSFDNRHTVFLDIDGVIVKHNYEIDGNEEYIKENIDFIKQLGNIYLVITSSRKLSQLQHVIKYLSNNGVSVDFVLSDLPTGKRIVVNDSNTVLPKAIAVELKRDEPISNEYRYGIVEEIFS